MKCNTLSFPGPMAALYATLLCLLLLPVPVSAAEIAAADTAPLQIHVTTGEEDGSIPLSGIILDLYQTDLTEMPRSVEAAEWEIKQYQTRSHLAATLMTDEKGIAVLDLDTEGIVPGIYLVTEQPNPAMSGQLAPFYIQLRGSSGDIHIQKVPEPAPDLSMDVGSLQQKSGSFDMDQPHTWIIRCEIPAGIATAKEFTVTDLLDNRLHYIPENLTVAVWKDPKSRLVLEKEIHYTVTKETIRSKNGPSDAVSVSLLPEGMTCVAQYLQAPGTGELRIYLPSAIGRNAALGAPIPNDAHLVYTNSAGVTYCADSDIPEVHTGGFHIRKTVEDGSFLPGVEYMIAREATQAELETESIVKEILQVGNDMLAVVYVDFYPGNSQEEKTYTAITDETGTAAIYGLAYGTYYLMESRPALGDSAGQPVRVQISAESHLTDTDGRLDGTGQKIDNTIEITNAAYRFPDTGGEGTIGIKAAGIFLIFSAGILLLDNRKKWV